MQWARRRAVELLGEARSAAHNGVIASSTCAFAGIQWSVVSAIESAAMRASRTVHRAAASSAST
jgi:hypothetical protein